MADKNVNLYFENLKDSKILEKTNEYEKYIILQNDFLHKKVAELETTINELSVKNEELESENDSLETAKISLKGYIKNEGEYNRLARQLNDCYVLKLFSFNKANDELTWYFKIIVLYTISVEICLACYKMYNCEYYDVLLGILIDVILIITVSRYVKMYAVLVSIKDINKDPKVIKIKKDMELAEKGNDFLGDVVDLL